MSDATSVKKGELECERIALSFRLLLGAYLAQLLVPLTFFVDSLQAARRDEAGTVEKTVIVVAGLWVLLGLGALAFTGDRCGFLRRASRPLVAVYALVLCVGLAEFGVRIGIRHFNTAPLLFKPGSKKVVVLTPWPMPGVSPRVTFTVNALGLRGPLPPHEGHVYKIIAVGGSTTECGALDDTQEWPYLLMQLMNQRQAQHLTWVNNAGVSGLTTVDHLSCLRRLSILTQADLLVFLIGVNDLEAALEYGGASTQEALEYKAELFAEHAPSGVRSTGGVFRRSWLFAMSAPELFNLTSGLKHLQGARRAEPQPQFSDLSEQRSAGPRLPLPDLQIGLQEYSQRVHRLGRECRVRRLRCVFLTQPSIWRADLSSSEQNLLWFGRVGWRGRVLGYASAGDLALAMDAYNQALLNRCRQDHLECYDLAVSIPKDTSAFLDDVHFNIGGARMVAEFLTARLLAAPPFGTGSP